MSAELIARLRRGDGNGCRHANELMREAADALEQAEATIGRLVNAERDRAEYEQEAATERHLRRRQTELALEQKARADDFEGRYETAHASRVWAEECLRKAEAERDALQARIDRVRVALETGGYTTSRVIELLDGDA